MALSSRIQQVGNCTAIQAQNAQIGDRRVWNGGSSTTLVSMKPKGKTMLVATYMCADGIEDVRVLKRTTPVVMFVEGSKNYLTIEERNTPNV